MVFKMAEVSEEDIKKDLNNIIDALCHLSPTRNYFLQLLDLLPRDYPRLREAYPQIFDSEDMRRDLKDKFGIKIGEEVEKGYGIASKLYGISEDAVDFFGDLSEEDKSKLMTFLGREEIPDLKREKWEHRIKMALQEPTIGQKCKLVMQTMFRTGEGDEYSVKVERMEDRTGIPREELLRIKNFLASELKLLTPKEGQFKFRYSLPGNYEELLRTYFGK